MITVRVPLSPPGVGSLAVMSLHYIPGRQLPQGSMCEYQVRSSARQVVGRLLERIRSAVPTDSTKPIRQSIIFELLGDTEFRCRSCKARSLAMTST
jgi:hypothetical protein